MSLDKEPAHRPPSLAALAAIKEQYSTRKQPTYDRFRISEETEPLYPAEDEERKTLVRKTLKKLQATPLDGTTFAMVTSAVIDLVGGVRSIKSSKKMAIVEAPFPNVSEVRFYHAEDQGSEYHVADPEKNRAKIRIITTAQSVPSIEYSFDGWSDSLGGNTIETNRERTGSPRALEEMTGHMGDLLLAESNAGYMIQRILKAYLANSEIDNKPMDDLERTDTNAQVVFLGMPQKRAA